MKPLDPVNTRARVEARHRAAARAEARLCRCGGCGGWLYGARACSTCALLLELEGAS